MSLLQLAHAVWMGRWNPRQDKEPSKKDGVGFKEFLISKYERKQWFRNPAEVRKEREKDSSAAAPEPKLLPPPSTKVHVYTVQVMAMFPIFPVPLLCFFLYFPFSELTITSKRALKALAALLVAIVFIDSTKKRIVAMRRARQDENHTGSVDLSIDRKQGTYAYA